MYKNRKPITPPDDLKIAWLRLRNRTERHIHIFTLYTSYIIYIIYITEIKKDTYYGTLTKAGTPWLTLSNWLTSTPSACYFNEKIPHSALLNIRFNASKNTKIL